MSVVDLFRLLDIRFYRCWLPYWIYLNQGFQAYSIFDYHLKIILIDLLHNHNKGEHFTITCGDGCHGKSTV